MDGQRSKWTNKLIEIVIDRDKEIVNCIQIQLEQKTPLAAYKILH